MPFRRTHAFHFLKPMSKSPVTIVVDPGVATGAAVFRRSVLVTSFTCEPPFNLLWSTLKRYANEPGTNVVIVVEAMPEVQRHRPETADLQKQLELAGCELVRPSEWKGHPAARLLQGDHPATKHERDAIRLGRYWIATSYARHAHAPAQS